MDFQKVVGAFEVVTDSAGRAVGLKYVSENDPRVQAAIEQVRQVPQSQAQSIEDGPEELRNIAVVAVQS